MWMRLQAVAFALALSFAAPASAGLYDEAAAALQRRDYARAASLLTPLADMGHVQAKRDLGDLYLWGLGVERDEVKAVALLRYAADAGDPAAQINMGFVHENGFGVEKSADEALRWYHRAADQRYVHAYNNLAAMYYDGKLLPKNLVRAYMWLSLAADSGSAMAKLGLQKMAAEMTPAQIEQARDLRPFK